MLRYGMNLLPFLLRGFILYFFLPSEVMNLNVLTDRCKCASVCPLHLSASAFQAPGMKLDE